MTVEDLMVDLASPFIVFIIMSKALVLKRSKRQLLLALPIFFILYLVIDFSMRFGFVGAVLATVLDMVGGVLIFGYFCEGDIWKNSFVHICIMQCARIVGQIASVVIEALRAPTMNLILRESVQGVWGTIGWIIIMLVTVYICSCIVNKYFHVEVVVHGKIYKYTMFVLISIASIAVIFQHEYGRQLLEKMENPTVYTVLVSICTFAALFLLGNAISYMYNQYEIKRLQKEKQLLDEIVIKHSSHYQELVETHRELQVVQKELHQTSFQELQELGNSLSNVPLSGNLIIDTIIGEYYKKAKQNNVLMDISIEPFSEISLGEKELAALLDNLLMQGYQMCEKTETDPWVALTLRRKNDMWMVKVEFSKSKEESLEKKSWFSSKFNKGKHQNDMQIVREIVSGYNGSVQVKEQPAEGSIDVFIPKI